MTDNYVFMKPLDLDFENFDQEVLHCDIPVLVDFWAPWCTPCQMMAPVLDELGKELDGKLKICKVDVENPENQALGSKYHVQSIPNMKLFKNGEVIEEFLGFRPKELFAKELQELL